MFMKYDKKNVKFFLSYFYFFRKFTCDDGLKVQWNGIHDDTTGIQKALDYEYENNLIVKFKQGIYLISKPLIMWASSSNYNNKLTGIIGDNRQVTKIYKPNSNVTDLKQHTFANACIIIANDKYKKVKQVVIPRQVLTLNVIMVLYLI